ncbi:MAG: hypothetical protein ACTSV2_17680 [Candidatus Thorarchaeota archaeon]
MTFWVVSMLALPIISIPMVNAWDPGDEAEIFGHTFTEEYWTNDSIEVVTEGGNASLTTSFVHKDNFTAFLIAFNSIQTNQTPSKEIILPYQLFGMHFVTPQDQEVFIGAIFAFLMVHNESYGSNNLPDVGNEDAWYIVPISSANPWGDVTPEVEPIPAEKLGENHYRFGMRYVNMSARVVSAAGGFLLSLLFPLVTVLFSEIVIEYDIVFNEVTGEVHVETLYTIGQVTRARIFFDLIEVDPRTIINETMCISAVHYLSIFTSNYEVTNSATNNTIVAPTSTTPLEENITITIGDDDERAFDIGLGRNYALVNESTTPWETVSDDETALNALLGARASDFLLIAWQAPMSIFLFAHMAYGLSDYVQSEYASPAALVNDAGSAFTSSQYWYDVTFPEWNGLRVEQDPVYVAYTYAPSGYISTSTTTPTSTVTDDGAGGVIFLGLLVVAVIAIVVLIRRRS